MQVRLGIVVVMLVMIVASLVAWGVSPGFLLLLVLALVQGGLLLWRYRISGTKLQVADAQLTWSSPAKSLTFDLAQQPVAAVVSSSWVGPQLRLADGTSLPVLRGSDDWEKFVTTLAVMQGSPITHVAGSGGTASRWYRRNPTGYFEER